MSGIGGSDGAYGPACEDGEDIIPVWPSLRQAIVTHRTTAGYAHLADGHQVNAAEKVGALITRAMDGTAPPPDAALSKPRRFDRFVRI